MTPDVVVLGCGGWHGRRLIEACAACGLVAAALPFAACRLEPEGVRLGGLAELPRVVLVRSIPAGTFQQVTLRLGFLHALESLGVVVLNPPRAIERCVDKAATSFHLASTGLPTPPTWAVERPERARAIVAAEAAAGHAVVLKPLFGAQGKGLRLLRRPEELPVEAEVAGVWYLQRYVEPPRPFEDYRVLVIGGRAIAAMRRRSARWPTNVRQGGVPEPVAADGELARLAVAAATAVGADHAGVDLIANEDGRLLVLEVNSMPAWQGLQSVTPVDIAAALVARLAARIAR
jgi:tetrahydromethanopterin:alpha-L-glutamate ligase